MRVAAPITSSTSRCLAVVVYRLPRCRSVSTSCFTELADVLQDRVATFGDPLILSDGFEPEFAQAPTGGAYSAPADPLAGLRGLLLRGGEGRERKGRGGRRG